MAAGLLGKVRVWALFDAFACWCLWTWAPQGHAAPSSQHLLGCGHRLLCSPVPPSLGTPGVWGAQGCGACGEGPGGGFGVSAVVGVPAECAVASGMLQ